MFVHKPILMLQSMRIRDAKAAVDEGGESSECTLLASDESEKQKKNVVETARKKGRTVCFATMMDVGPLQKLGVGTEVTKYTGRVVFRGDIVQEDFGS